LDRCYLCCLAFGFTDLAFAAILSFGWFFANLSAAAAFIHFCSFIGGLGAFG
jgi:hypothetical protein